MSAVETVDRTPQVFAAPVRILPTDVPDAIQTMHRLRRQAWDVDTNSRSVFMLDNGEVIVPGREGLKQRLLPGAAQQLAQWHGVPWTYVQKMASAGRSDLLARNFNAWSESDASPMLVRGNSDAIRAVLSDSYKVIWNLDAFTVAAEEAQRVGGELKFHNGLIEEDRTTLRVRIPGVCGAVKVGDTIESGFEFGASETGRGSVYINAYTFRLSCTNGATVRVEERTRIVHLGRQDDSFTMDRVRAGVRGAIRTFNDYLGQMQRAANTDVPDPTQALRNVVKTYEFSEDQLSRILVAFGGEPERTMYGVLNAVTAAAQLEPRFEDRANMEQVAGTIAMAPDSWAALNAPSRN